QARRTAPVPTSARNRSDGARWQRSLRSSPNDSVTNRSTAEPLRRPVRREGPELVADVEADVVALRVYDKIGRPGDGAREAFSLRRRHDPVAGTEHDEKRAFDPIGAALETEAVGDLLRRAHAAGAAANAKQLLRHLWELRQHAAEIERAAIGDARADARLEGGCKRRIDRTEALPNHRDRTGIDVRAPFQDVDDGA